MLTGERDFKAKLLTKIRAENAISERAKKQNALAKNKRDEARKALRLIRDGLNQDLNATNKEIIEQSWLLDQETRRYNDKDLLNKTVKETMGLKQENNQCNIDINIAESRMQDLGDQKEMQNLQLNDILTEKRKIEKENMELEYKIQGRGVTEADQKAKLFEAERHLEKELRH